jgi:sensor histidine kinase YesM
LKELEAMRAQAELRNLRNQINPHFLLNTLNNIYALTAFDTAKAQEAIQELSKMMRHILYEYQKPLIPLKEEIDFLENYVKLMRIRLPQSVEVTFNATHPKGTVEVAPMILISLVENAFKHGTSPTEPSFVHINITAEESKLICDIQNSNNPKTASDHSGHGIGLQQVKRRLELAYPNRYTWQQGTKDNDKTYYSTITIQL